MKRIRLAEAFLLGSIIAAIGFFGFAQYVIHVRLPV